MENRPYRLSKPLYEALPYAYMAVGVIALWVANRLAGHVASDLALVFGIVSVLAGLVLVLRRREYRTTRARYTGAPLDLDDRGA